jgi:hypothetical protein
LIQALNAAVLSCLPIGFDLIAFISLRANLARNRLVDMTLLHYFASRKDADVCRLLVRHGADPSIRCSKFFHENNEATGPTPIELYDELQAIIERESTAIGRLGKKAQSIKRFVDMLFVFEE